MGLRPGSSGELHQARRALRGRLRGLCPWRGRREPLKIESMEEKSWIEMVGLVASIVLPFFNIPLVVRMIRRKSSEDLSLVWVVGVFVCIVAVFPAAWISPDSTFKIFQTLNLLFFSVVTFFTIYYRM